MSNNEKETKKKVETAPEATEKKKTGMKSLKYGSMSAIIIAIVVAIVVVVNIMAIEMEKRNPMKIDLTKDKRYDISEETIEVLGKLERDVDILVTMPKSDFEVLAENQSAYMSYQLQMMNQYYGTNYNETIEVPYDMIPVILEKYEMYSRKGDGKGNVNVKYVDLSIDPDAVTKYQSNYDGGEIASNSIVIASGDNVRVIPTADIVSMLAVDEAAMQNNTFSLVFAGESRITSDIMNVVDTNIIDVAIIKTANGQDIYRTDDADIVTAIENELLSKNGYSCTSVDIIKDELDTEKYDMVLIPMPQNDFTEDGIKKLQDFLYNDEMYGKNMVFIPCYTNINSPNLDEFLADWSIKIENALIGDPKNYMGDYPGILLSVSDDESVGELPNKSLPIIAPFSREISVLGKNNQNVVTEVLKSSQTSGILQRLDEEENTDTLAGARNVAVISKRERAEQLDIYTSRVMAFGSSMMFYNEYMVQTGTYNNANVILNMLNIANGKEVSAVIPEKALQQNYIAPTSGESRAIKIIIVVIAAGIAITGLVVLLRRKNR
ncbi:MAG: GldG family protein [Ruminococcus sp.]|nr:GldG family protein [Ruminococcus sp.]